MIDKQYLDVFYARQKRFFPWVRRTSGLIPCVAAALGVAMALFDGTSDIPELLLYALLALWAARSMLVGLVRSQNWFVGDLLWEGFVKGLTRTSAVIAAPVIGDERNAPFGDDLLPHYATTIRGLPALLDKVTFGYHLINFSSRHAPFKPSLGTFTLRYMVLAVELNQPVPHIFIDGRAQNRFGFKSRDLWSLTKKVSKRNKIPALEGDFNNYFDVYAVPGSNIETLTILTPDTMIALRDQGYSFDYELYGTKLYVISEPTLRRPEDYAAYTKAVEAALFDLVPQITHHTFTPVEASVRITPGRLSFWAFVYSAAVLGRFLLWCAGLGAISYGAYLLTQHLMA